MTNPQTELQNELEKFGLHNLLKNIEYIGGDLGLKAFTDFVKHMQTIAADTAREERDKQWSDAFDEIVEEANLTYGGWVPLIAVKESILEALQQDTKE